jgi:predicted ATP-grasp superfamily ATP-dependent carboligase
MNTTTSKLKNILDSQPVKNADKLKKQQEYYKKLTETGIAKKQTYKLKPISAI